MRAFVALTPPAGALAELDAAVGPVRAAHPDLRWTPPAQWHLTLAFLGEIDEAVLPELGERLSRAARRHPPLALALGGAGRFGDRVLWTRVHATPESPRPTPGELRISPGELRTSPGEFRVPLRQVARSGTQSPAFEHAAGARSHGGLRRLAASVAAAARRCGIAVDQRPYRPHLTLARGRDGVDLRPLVAALAGFAGGPWTAETLHLVRSRLGTGPGATALHDVIETWPLGR